MRREALAVKHVMGGKLRVLHCWRKVLSRPSVKHCHYLFERVGSPAFTNVVAGLPRTSCTFLDSTCCVDISEHSREWRQIEFSTAGNDPLEDGSRLGENKNEAQANGGAFGTDRGGRVLAPAWLPTSDGGLD